MNNKIPLRQAQLIKRMAWRQIDLLDRKNISSEDEKHLSFRAVRMLTFIACLNYAMLYLESDLAVAGKLRDNKRRYFYMAKHIASDAHQTAYKMLASINDNVGYEYHKALDTTWKKIDECILLPPLEKSYSIVCALCRLIGTLNKELGKRYYFAPAQHIERIPHIMDVQGVEDKNVDRIIDVNIE